MIKTKKERVLLTPDDFKPSSNLFEVTGAINPGAVRVENDEIVLYVRVIEKLKKGDDDKYEYSPRMCGEDNFEIKIDKFNKKDIVSSSELDFSFKDGTKRLKFISHLRRVVLSRTGFKVKSIEQKPSFFGLSWDGELGIEDARITKIGELYVMTYVSLSSLGNITTNLAISNDCLKWYRRGIIFLHQNKDVVIFPERINHNYVAFNRPEGDFEFSSPHIWISFSENLTYWGGAESLKLSEKGAWDSGKIGAGPPPIKTKKGWLFIYHGLIDKRIKNKNLIVETIRKLLGHDDEVRTVYCAGSVLLDINNPKKIIAKTSKPILIPHNSHERGISEDKDVVFPTGIVIDENGENILLFCGGADRVTSVKKISLEKVFEMMRWIK